MHPTKETVEALPRIIDYMQKNNFKVTTVSENLGEIIAWHKNTKLTKKYSQIYKLGLRIFFICAILIK